MLNDDYRQVEYSVTACLISNFLNNTYHESILNCSNPREISKKLFTWKYIDLSRSTYQQAFFLKEQRFASLKVQDRALSLLCVQREKFSPWHLSCYEIQWLAYDVMARQIFISQTISSVALSAENPKINFQIKLFPWELPVKIQFQRFLSQTTVKGLPFILYGSEAAVWKRRRKICWIDI